MAEFRMPALGADMDQGTLLEWLVRPGDVVRRGDIVAVVDTAKAAVEVECFHGGVVEALLVEPGVRVPVGTPLARITGPPAASPPAPMPTAPAGERRGAPATAPTGADVPAPFPPVRHLARLRHLDLASVRGSGPQGRVTHADVEHATPRVHASPLARRVADELGVDLAALTGTGPGGAIGVEDVRRAATGRVSGPVTVGEPAARDRTAAMREAIAALMSRSKREIPHYYVSESIDLHRAMDWLNAQNRTLAVAKRLVPSVLLLKAAAVAAREVPGVNGFWAEHRFTPAPTVHLGVAVSLRAGGVVAPAIHDAQKLEVHELMARLRDLVGRARTGRLRRAELADPTITVTNLGDQGVEAIFGVIYPPQVALVGFGRIADRPMAVDGLIGVRPAVTATLAADHRATDGAVGARYLHAIAQLLQSPEQL